MLVFQMVIFIQWDKNDLAQVKLKDANLHQTSGSACPPFRTPAGLARFLWCRYLPAGWV